MNDTNSSIGTVSTKRKVWLTSSEALSELCDLLPSNKGRQSLVTSLIKAYGLDIKCEDIISVTRIKRKELETFHGKDYLDEVLKRRPKVNTGLSNLTRIKRILQLNQYKDIPEKSARHADENIDILKLGEDIVKKYTTEINDNSDDDSSCFELSDSAHEVSFEEEETQDDDEVLEHFGLLHDCSVFPFMSEYVKLVAASSIHTADRLVKEKHDGNVLKIAINWYGGRHHCKKNRAAGFCYINDIVLGINTLRRSYRKVFYLDLDLHHGDGVESAFEFSKNVMTCSVHRYDLGFYPGTGTLGSTNDTKVNIPVMKGLNNHSMLKIVQEIVIPLIKNFEPGALVIQAGCDGLSTDDHKEWNMTIDGYGRVLKELLAKSGSKSVMILGGGGYNHIDTAKCWTYLTRIALAEENMDEWDMIPDHHHIDSYESCGFKFWTDENSNPRKIKDENSPEYIEELKAHIFKKCL